MNRTVADKYATLLVRTKKAVFIIRKLGIQSTHPAYLEFLRICNERNSFEENHFPPTYSCFGTGSYHHHGNLGVEREIYGIPKFKGMIFDSSINMFCVSGTKKKCQAVFKHLKSKYPEMNVNLVKDGNKPLWGLHTYKGCLEHVEKYGLKVDPFLRPDQLEEINDIRDQIISLREEEKAMILKLEVYREDRYPKPLPHNLYDTGWDCEAKDNPYKRCVTGPYHEDDNDEGCCIYCGEPEERK